MPLAVVSLLVSSSALLAQEAIPYTPDQAEAGKQLYRDNCQKCHGNTLTNGQFGTPLKGAFFRLTWKGKSVGELLDYMYEKMPSDVPSRLTREEYAQLGAYIFLQNEFVSSEQALTEDPAVYTELMLPF